MTSPKDAAPREYWIKVDGVIFMERLPHGNSFKTLVSEFPLNGTDLEPIHVIEKSAYDRAVAEVERLRAKLSQNKCNSGHETLPLELWDCPACADKLHAENATLRSLVGKADRIIYGFDKVSLDEWDEIKKECGL